jgi:hypothetical protein
VLLRFCACRAIEATYVGTVWLPSDGDDPCTAALVSIGITFFCLLAPPPMVAHLEGWADDQW